MKQRFTRHMGHLTIFILFDQNIYEVVKITKAPAEFELNAVTHCAFREQFPAEYEL